MDLWKNSFCFLVQTFAASVASQQCGYDDMTIYMSNNSFSSSRIDLRSRCEVLSMKRAVILHLLYV